MATIQSSRGLSPYYPPRARWYSFLFWRVDRLLWWVNLNPETGWEETTLSLIAIFLVPGLGFYLRGPMWLGKIACTVSAMLLAAFVIFLGYPAAGWSLAALLSLHASGVLHRSEALIGKSLGYRIGASIAVTLILSVCVYLPARHMVEQYFFMPLQLNGRTVVVRTVFSKSALRRGDEVAYSVRSADGHSLFVAPGLDIGTVVAVPGDRVQFSNSALVVNGVAQPPLPYLSLPFLQIVPAKHWLVRPNLKVTVNPHFGDRAAYILWANDLVPEQRLVGKPFQSWFGRRQTQP